MKLLITGANGFLGNHVVCQAIRRGHTVRALVRPSAQLAKTGWFSQSGIEVVRGELTTGENLPAAVREVDCVIHLAAAKSGNAEEQFEATVRATEHLMTAMQQASVWRLVAISSLSVYDFSVVASSALIDETSRVEADGVQRDTYARTKLLQERLIRKFADEEGWDLVVLRPGMIWGKGRILNAWLGAPISSKLWMLIGGNALVPLTYVENCAEAVILAAETQSAAGQTINIIDDDAPTQKQFLSLALHTMSDHRRIISVPYGLLHAAAGGGFWINQKLFDGKLQLPGLLVPCRLDARAKPLHWSNLRAKKLLGWTPRYRLFAAMDRATASSG